MRKRSKPTPEFDNFTGFMDKLAQVPHSELKASLDAERAAKKRGVRFLREGKQNPLVQAANDVFQKAARRKIN